MLINEITSKKEYYFLFDKSKYINNDYLFLTLAGSYAYGTETEKSDIDIRGVLINTEKELFGISSFDSFRDDTTDTTIYSFKKYIKLLLNYNVHMLEYLSHKEYLLLTRTAGLLIENIDIFISKNNIASYEGIIKNFLIKTKTKKLTTSDLNKSYSNILRIYYTYKDFLETGKIIVYREKEKELLKKIKQGVFIEKEILEMIAIKKEEIEYSKKYNVLKSYMDLTDIEDLVSTVNRNSLKDL